MSQRVSKFHESTSTGHSNPSGLMASMEHCRRGSKRSAVLPGDHTTNSARPSVPMIVSRWFLQSDSGRREYLRPCSNAHIKMCILAQQKQKLSHLLIWLMRAQGCITNSECGTLNMRTLCREDQESFDSGLTFAMTFLPTSWTAPD